ncbi:serine/threonine protein kinase, partial [Myxococcota bacterium]|nr:serine/threonine protein kinase [Myxococcota bacterium]
MHSLPDNDLHGLLGAIVDGRFRVLRLHHFGPNGALYEVEPPSVGRARKGLKLLTLPEARDPKALERLERFVKRYKAITHRHLVKVNGLGWLSDQTPYLIVEWCPWPGLDEVLRRGPLEYTMALQILRAVAWGLDVLHKAGLHHGDLRPAHVRFKPGAGMLDEVKLSDAGIHSRLRVGPSARLSPQLPYTAPERLGGGAATIAADVYSLGALAYQLFTGQLPFTPQDPRGEIAGPDPVARLRWLHLNALPHQPCRGMACPPFSPAVEAVIGRALSKDPAARFSDAHAFRVAFERALVLGGEDDLTGLFAAADEAAPPIEAAAPAPPPYLRA